MKPCVSQATTLRATFAEDVEAFGDAACPAMEVWLTKLEQHLEKNTAADTQKQLRDRNVTLAAGSFQGGLLLSQGEQRKVHYDLFQRRLALCQEFGIGTLVIVGDFQPGMGPQELDRVTVSLAHAAQLASAFDVRLALEFQASAPFCRSLDTALGLITAVNLPNLGLCLDLFHYYTGPSKFEDLRGLTADNLFLVQVSDLIGMPRELATDADRILPGDGDFQTLAILQELRQRGYDGWVSVELLNPNLWQIKPLQVVEAATTAIRRLLAQTELAGGAAAP